MLARSMVRGSIWQKMSASQHLSHTMKCERFAALTKSTWYLKYPKMNWNLSYLNSSVTCWDRNLNSKMTTIYDYDSYDMMAIFSRVFQPFKGFITQVWWIWRRSSWPKGRRTAPTTSGICGSTSGATICAIGMQIASWKGADFFAICCFKKRNYR